MPSNFTENYQLSQWVKSDQVKMEDFNADNAKLDGAIKAQADALAAHGEALAKLGNGRVHIGSYVGTGQCGQEHPTSYTFPVMPVYFFIVRPNGLHTMMGKGGARDAAIINGGNMTLTWNGNTASWYSTSETGQFNISGSVYLVVTFYEV